MKNICKLLSLILALACVLSFASCDLSDTDGTATDASTDSSPAPQKEKFVYRFNSNGDGTCTLSYIEVNASFDEEINLELPSTSPSGERVTKIDAAVTKYGNVPRYLLPEDFTSIVNTLEKNTEGNPSLEFQLKKLLAYYIEFDLKKSSEDLAEQLKKEYPALEISPFVKLDDSAAIAEMHNLSKLLYEHAGYTRDKALADHAKFMERMSKDGKALFEGYELYPSLGNVVSITIPEGVEEIGSTFACTSAKTVSLPSTLKKVNAMAFYECESLKEISVPAGVTEIYASAFFGFENVSFGGTMAQWQAAFVNDMDSKDLYTVTCTDGVIQPQDSDKK